MTNQRDLARSQGDRWRDRLNAGVLASASLLLYAMTRTRDFGGDDTVFAQVVQRWLDVGSIEQAFIHPLHPLYNPLVALCSWAVRSITGAVFVLDVGAGVSACAAAVAVAGVYLILRHSGVHDEVALLASVVFSVSGGMWRYATRMESYAVAVAAVVIWLAATSDERASWRKLAPGFAAPVLGHTFLVLLVVPGAWLHRHRPRTLGAALMAGLVVPSSLVVAVQARFRDSRSGASLIEFIAGPESGRWFSLPDPLAVLEALRGLVVLRSYGVVPLYPSWMTTFFDIVGGLAILGLGALAVWGSVVSIRDRRRPGIAAILGLAVLVPFWLLWDEGRHAHGVVTAIPLVIVLVALGLSTLDRRKAIVVLASVAMTLLIINGIGSILPESQAHLSRTLVVSNFVHDTVSADGTLVTVGIDPKLRLALPYLSGRRVVDLTAIVHSARRWGATSQEALDGWLHLATTSKEAWLLEEPDSPIVLEWIHGLGISEEMWSDARRSLRLGQGETLAADGLVVFDPITLRRLEEADFENPRSVAATRR